MAYRFRLIFLLFLPVLSFDLFANGLLNTYSAQLPGGRAYNSNFYTLDSAKAELSSTYIFNLTGYYFIGFYAYTEAGFYTSHNVIPLGCKIGDAYEPTSRLCGGCPPELELNGNSCELPKPPDTCEALADKCKTLEGSKSYIVDLPMSKSQFKQFKPFTTCTPAGLVPGCNRGCVVSSSGFGGLNTAQNGSTFFHGEGTITSGTCLPSSPSPGGEEPKEEDNPLPPSEPDEKPCKPGEYQGTVNGTKVCLPAKSKETVVKQETIENNDGSKTDTVTTVSCEGGKCTVTETATNKDSSGATTGTVNKETGISQSNFCAQNPGSEVCKGTGEDGQDDKSTFTGSCASNFKCEGDSVQCAIALQQHETACKLFDESNPYWQAFKDAEAGNSTGVEATSVDLASHVSTDSVIGAGACPADIEVVVFNQTVPFALSKFCPYFDAMGMLIMLGAAVGCLRILGSG